MKTAGILFSAPMIQALRRPIGPKTQTRRLAAPRWAPGDLLYVREGFSGPHAYMAAKIPPTDWPVGCPIHYWADGDPQDGDWCKPKPGMHQPRWASRITLKVVEVRREPLCAISEEDALAEGVVYDETKLGFWVPGVEHPNRDFPFLSRATAREMYAALWDVINDSGSWLGNPSVFVTTFETPILENVDAYLSRSGLTA